MDFANLNHAAVVLAAVSTFVLGAIWWSPLMFEKRWKAENNFSDEFLKKGSMARIFTLSFLFTMVMAYNLALFLNAPVVGATKGAWYGFLTGFGWVAMAIFILGLFERRSWKLMFINGVYMAVSFALMGMIIGGWR
jgi:hypothetical protein